MSTPARKRFEDQYRKIFADSGTWDTRRDFQRACRAYLGSLAVGTIADGQSLAALALDLGLPRATVYRAWREVTLARIDPLLL